MAETIADPISREQLIDMMLGCKTRIECETALALANRFVERHPDDLDFAHMLEVPGKVIEAYKLGLL